jgi:RNA polymerase sigma-70 factor (ECF subfamily)
LDLLFPKDDIVVSAMIESLFVTHARALGAYFRRRLGKDVDTDDLIQEVYVRLLRVNVKDIRNAEAYLFAVAANLWKEQALLQSRNRKLRDVDDPLVQEQLADMPSFEGKLDAEMHAKRLRRALHELPPKCQAVVAMHYRHGMNYEQIGAQLEISVHMVKKYIMYALAHCRRRMAGLR